MPTIAYLVQYLSYYHSTPLHNQSLHLASSLRSQFSFCVAARANIVSYRTSYRKRLEDTVKWEVGLSNVCPKFKCLNQGLNMKFKSSSNVGDSVKFGHLLILFSSRSR